MLTTLIADPGRVEVVGVGATEAAAIESIHVRKPDIATRITQLARAKLG
jgi:hypothetical protein